MMISPFLYRVKTLVSACSHKAPLKVQLPPPPPFLRDLLPTRRDDPFVPSLFIAFRLKSRTGAEATKRLVLSRLTARTGGLRRAFSRCLTRGETRQTRG